MSSRRKVLITGAGGRIGSFLTRTWADVYDMVLVDRKPMEPPEGARSIVLDIVDVDAVKSACAGVDTVVHLAAVASPNAGFDESVLHANIIGTHNLYRAAAEAGVKRVVFASTIHTVGAYPPDVQVKWDMPVRPCCEYGASKCYGEALGSYFADKRGLSVIAIRIGGVHGHAGYPMHQGANIIDIGISYDDLAQLITKCVEAPEDLRFAIVNGLSDNRFKRLDISRTRELLGYDPEDDSGEDLADYNVPEPVPVHPG